VLLAAVIALLFVLYRRNTAAWERAAGAEDEVEDTVPAVQASASA
jgi:galactitol PTS system EIIC component